MKSKLLLFSYLVFVSNCFSQNIQITQITQPTTGGRVQNGNLILDYTIGEPHFGTLQNNNLMLTGGFQQSEIPQAPVAPASQTVCSDTAYTFVFPNFRAGAGGDQIEWSLNSDCTGSNTITSGDTLSITVAIGNTDTIWLRSRVSGSGMVSNTIVSAILKVNLKPAPPTPPAPVAVNSDTAYTFNFANLHPGFGGNQLEWSFDSSFATSWLMTCYDTTMNGKDTSDCTISFTISPQSDTMFWLRSIDTLTGCVSNAKASIAIVTNIFQRQPITVDSVINICSGTSTTIKIFSSNHSNHYDLLTDTGTVTSIYGNDTTLNISTGNVFTNTFFTVLSTDTTTSDTIELGYVLVSVLGAVDTNVYIEGDTLVYVNDSSLYHGTAMYGIKAIYSIINGSATVDSSTGWVYSMSGDSFTLRATMYGSTSCGNTYEDLKVHVTDIAPPVAPTPKTMIVDTDIVVAVSFDSIIVGAGGDEIEWSVRATFDEYSTINPYGTISINLAPGMDTIIWLRSNKKSTGKKSKAVFTRARTLHPLLSAGLLDKTHWSIQNNLSDEFDWPFTFPEFNNDPIIFPTNKFSDKWALNYCWGEDCSSSFCDNHSIWTSVTDGSGTAYFNKENDGSGGEVTFANGIASFKSERLTPEYVTDCVIPGRADYPQNTFYYKGGLICSKNYIDLSKPGLLEVRCKTPAGVGAYPAFWTFPGIEFDVMEDPIEVTNDEGRMTSVIHTSWGPSGVWCGRAIWKKTLCGYTQDWHTYSVVFSTSKIIFFVDGKETWSIDRDAQTGTKFPFDNAYGLARIILASGTTGGVNNTIGDPDYEMLVDYIRYYQPADGTANLPHSLQNTVSNVAKTLESLNANGQQDPPNTPNNRLLEITNTTDHQTHEILYGKIAYTNETNLGLQKLYYTGYIPGTNGSSGARKCYNAYLDNGLWYEYPLVDWITDILGEVTADKDRVYYLSSSLEIKYFQWVYNTSCSCSTWVNFGTGVYSHGSFNTDNLHRLFYISDDDNIEVLQPTNTSNGNQLQITNGNDVCCGLTVHSSGIMMFYEDENEVLKQTVWLNNTGYHSSIGNSTPLPLFALDENRWRLYYIDKNDEDIHQYDYSFPQQSQSVFTKLGGNPLCSDNNNAISIPLPFYSFPVYYSHPKGIIALSNDKDEIYYRGKDNRIWYYFTDYDHGINASGNSIKQNWYKTPVNYSEAAGGTLVFEPYDLGKLFFAGGDRKLHVADYLDADNPVDCPSVYWGDHDAYKTDNSDYTENRTDKNNKIITESENISISILPNPSLNTFTIFINGLQNDGVADIKIQGPDGRIVYNAVLSNTAKAVWVASNANSGIYYCLITTGSGKVVSGKMIKI